MMDRVMVRVMDEDPFVYDNFKGEKPLYDALVPHEVFLGSHFERRFVTPFGKIWEDLAEIVGASVRGYATTGKMIVGDIPAERLLRIDEILSKLEHGKVEGKKIKPNWDTEFAYIMEGGGELRSTSVMCDLYVEDTATKERFAFELKAPLPNSDQTLVSKTKILKLYAMVPPQVDNAYYALPYNPYGKKEDYAWAFPKRWFDMNNDKVVLIGDEFWDLIGGAGTLKEIVGVATELGDAYKKRIRKEYFKMLQEEE